MAVVFFDIDDTLIDYKLSETRTIELIIRKYKLNVPHYMEIWRNISEKYFNKYLNGKITFTQQGMKRMSAFFLGGGEIIDDSKAQGLFFEYKELLEQSWTVFEDVVPCLEKIKNYNLGIASNGENLQQQHKLKMNDIQKYFYVETYASEINTAKPERAFFDYLKQQSHDGEYVYIGDNLKTDIYPCVEMGIKSIWMNRKGCDVHQGIVAVNSLVELPQIIENMFRKI